MTGLIGRTEELALLADCWECVVNGGSAVVFVEGTAGIGKSFLVETFLERLRAATPKKEPLLLGQSRCVSFEGRPEALRPLIEASGNMLLGTMEIEPGFWNSIIDSRAFGVLSEVLPELGVPGVGLVMKVGQVLLGGGSGRETKEAAHRQSRSLMVRDMLLKASAKRPLVLFIDDLHWADPDSLNLLAELFQTLWDDKSAHRVLFIAAVRSVEGMDVLRRLRVLVDRADRGGPKLLQEIVLSGLGSEEVQHLAGVPTGGRALSEDLVAWIHQYTAGSPMAVQDLVAGLIADSLVIERDGVMVAVEPIHERVGAGWETGPRLKAWLESAGRDPAARLASVAVASLPTDDADLLRTASLVGREFGTAFLANVVGRTELEVIRALRRCERSGILREKTPLPGHSAGSSGCFEFVTARHLDVLRRDLSKRETLLLQKQIADVLASERRRLADSVTSINELMSRTNRELYREVHRAEAALASCEARLVHHLDAAGRPLDAARMLCETNLRVEDLVETELPVRVATGARLRHVLERAEDLLAEAGRRSNYDDPKTFLATECWTTLLKARIHHIEGRYDLALPVQLAAIRQARSTGAGELVVQSLLERGTTLQECGNHKAARVAFQEALDALDASTAAQFLDSIPIEFIGREKVLARYEALGLGVQVAAARNEDERDAFVQRGSDVASEYLIGAVEMVKVRETIADARDDERRELFVQGVLDELDALFDDEMGPQDDLLDPEEAEQRLGRAEELVRVVADLAREMGRPDLGNRVFVTRALMLHEASVTIEDALEDGDLEISRSDRAALRQIVEVGILSRPRVRNALEEGIRSAETLEGPWRFLLRISLAESHLIGTLDEAKRLLDAAGSIAARAGDVEAALRVGCARVRVLAGFDETAAAKEEARRLAVEAEKVIDTFPKEDAVDLAGEVAQVLESVNLLRDARRWNKLVEELENETGKEAVAVEEDETPPPLPAPLEFVAGTPGDLDSVLASASKHLRRAQKMAFEDKDGKALENWERARALLSNHPMWLALGDDILAGIAEAHAGIAAACRLAGNLADYQSHWQEANATWESAVEICLRTQQIEHALEILGNAEVSASHIDLARWHDRLERRIAISLQHGNLDGLTSAFEDATGEADIETVDDEDGNHETTNSMGEHEEPGEGKEDEEGDDTDVTLVEPPMVLQIFEQHLSAIREAYSEAGDLGGFDEFAERVHSLKEFVDASTEPG